MIGCTHTPKYEGNLCEKCYKKKKEEEEKERKRNQRTAESVQKQTQEQSQNEKNNTDNTTGETTESKTPSEPTLKIGFASQNPNRYDISNDKTLKTKNKNDTQFGG